MFLPIVAAGSLKPYFPLYCNAIGLTATEMSVILCSMPISAVLFIPGIVTLADKWQCHKQMIIITSILSAGKLIKSEI